MFIFIQRAALIQISLLSTICPVIPPPSGAKVTLVEWCERLRDFHLPSCLPSFSHHHHHLHHHSVSVSRKSRGLSMVNNISTLHKLRPIRTESCWKFHELSTSAVIWKQNEVQSIAAIQLHYSIMWACDSTNKFISAVSTLIFRSHSSWVECWQHFYSEELFCSSNFYMYCDFSHDSYSGSDISGKSACTAFLYIIHQCNMRMFN